MQFLLVFTGLLSLALGSLSEYQYRQPAQQSPTLNPPSATNSGNSLDSLDSAIPGLPGIDYPIYSRVPRTTFQCDDKVNGGFYADPEADCQAFHVCAGNGRGGVTKYSFLCPNGTIFQQQYLVCDWWYNVDCSIAQDLYSRNDEIAAEREAYGRRQIVVTERVTLPPTTRPPPPPPSPTPTPFQNIQLSSGVSIPRRSQNIQLGNNISIPRKASQTLQRSDTLSPSFALPRVQTPPEPILLQQQQQQQSLDGNSVNDNLFVGPVNQNTNANNINVGELQFGSRSGELSVLPVSSNSQFQSEVNQLGDDANIPRFTTQFQAEASAPGVMFATPDSRYFFTAPSTGYIYPAPSTFTRFRSMRRKSVARN